MKRNLVILLLLLLIFLSGCSEDAVLDTLPDYLQKEMYTEGEFQDYTDYGVYTYLNFDQAILEDNLYFKPISEFGLDNILSYIENFEGWVSLCPEDSELVTHYDFDKTCMDACDYVYIDTKEGEPIGTGGSKYGKFDHYAVYFFDTDTYTLYYFHSNI